jgi:hypothetical protein
MGLKTGSSAVKIAARKKKELSLLRNITIPKENIKNKKLKGTGVTYSGIKTSSQGLLTGAITEKKTLLGG